MDLRQQMLQLLHERTLQNDFTENALFTAVSLADACSLSRNTASQYLNDLVKKKLIIKINTRPVYFFHKAALQQKINVVLEEEVYASFDDIFARQQSAFAKLIGSNGSLQSVVEQCKAALSYPTMQGLPILLHGPTGTGKTFIASLMHEYAIKQKLIDPSGQFIAVNCSEYANNPELLTANLFGYTKGAYTGAEEDQQGLIALANNGILFLDEVHSLKAECQEKLFHFMDKGIYHRLGDNEKWFKSNCRLIFATTENPQNALLKTLLRRIPIVVSVPALKNRPILEKRELIYSMFAAESRQLQKEIAISNLAYQAILDYDFKGNVGEMKNSIKATCARLFTKTKTKQLPIHLLDLSDTIFETMKSVQTKAIDMEKETLLSLDDLRSAKKAESTLTQFYQRVLTILQNNRSYDDLYPQLILPIKHVIQNFVDYLFFKQKYYLPSSNEEFLIKMVDKIYSLMINKYSLNIPNNQIKQYTKFLMEYSKNSTESKVWVTMHQNEIKELGQLIYDHYPRAARIASEIIENIAVNLDIEMDKFMVMIMAISLIKTNQENNNGRIGLILCHGYSTASSIADTANHMLGQHIFDGIDMELRISMDKIVQLVDEYLKSKVPVQELMLLVDMGSLEEIYEKITPLSDCNIGLINHVSTATALEVGNLIKQGKNVHSILTSIKENYTLSTHFIEGKQKQETILTVCATGFGSAKKISELLIHSLPKTIDLMILPYDYQSLVEHGKKDSVFNEYDVKLIVGTLDPQVPQIPYIAMESIMTHSEIKELRHLIGKYLSPEELEQFNQNVLKNFTLSNIVNHLTILNAEKVMEDVEEIVQDLEKIMHKSLTLTTKMGLYVHLSCLIERLILKQEIQSAEGMKSNYDEFKEEWQQIKDAFSGAEVRYSVEVPSPEISYVMNYFKIDEE